MPVALPVPVLVVVLSVRDTSNADHWLGKYVFKQQSNIFSGLLLPLLANNYLREFSERV